MTQFVSYNIRTYFQSGNVLQIQPDVYGLYKSVMEIIAKLHIH